MQTATAILRMIQVKAGRTSASQTNQ